MLGERKEAGLVIVVFGRESACMYYFGGMRFGGG